MKKKKRIRLLFTFLFALIGLLYSVYETNYIKEPKQINKREETNTVINQIDNNLKVYFIDVGQADCILIKTKNNNILIDAGNNEDGENLVNYLKSLNINKLDYVFATHAHEDHIGGMDTIINNFSITNFYMPNAYTTTKTFEDMLDSLLEKNIKVTTPIINDQIEVDNSIIKILNVGDDKKNLNDTSIILKLIHKNNKFLFMGDASSKVERELLDKYDLRSDVLKIGHHGSSYSSNIKFLEAVKPKYSVIEVGKNNIYNHPLKETLKKLKDINSKIYRTDENNTIIFESNGDTINITTEITNTNG